jgi:hypothetical protein
MNAKVSVNSQTDGLRAVCTLPDLYHHALYEVFVNVQYVESVGNLGPNAQRALEFYRRKRRNQTVEIKIMPCRLPACKWGQQ